MVKHIHFLGIGGSGASAAAAIAQAQGYEITGCDLEPFNEFTTPFKKSQLFKGHSSKHLVNIDILAVTPAIYSLDPNNPELLEAKKQGIEVLTWQEFVGKYLMKDKFVIAVCGTHGKTTTTAMIAKILEDAGLDPTVLLGAIAPWWGTNYRIPRQTVHDRKYFVTEADEYNDNFLAFKPDISVVINIEMDHPEYFKDFEAYKESFKKFLLQTKSTVVANLSDPAVNQMSSDRGTNVQILDYSKYLIDFPLQIPGEFNRWNASAAYQAGIALRISPQTIKKSLYTYKGIGRRFEYLGKFHPSTHSINTQVFDSEVMSPQAQTRRGRTEWNRSTTHFVRSGQAGAKVYSDFGHHPTEIKATMEAAREKFPKSKIWLIYEPHMFTRTKALFDDFVKVLKEIPVDQVIITDIYQSREVDKGLVNSQQLVEAVGNNTLVYHSKDNLKGVLEKEVQNGDIIFFMGAGDIDRLARTFMKNS